MGLSKNVGGFQTTIPFVNASKGTEPPMQILVSGETDNELWKTSSVTGTVTEPQLSEMTTEKVVVEVIVATGFEIFGLFNKFAGVQL